MADSTPLLGEGELPQGIQPGARYLIKVKSHPDWKQLEGASLDVQRTMASDKASDAATLAIVHLRVAGVWELAAGEQPDTVRLKLAWGHGAQPSGWLLGVQGEPAEGLTRVEVASGEGVDFLEPVGDDFRLKAASGQCSGWYLGIGESQSKAMRDPFSFYTTLQEPSDAEKVLWSLEQLDLSGDLGFWKNELVQWKNELCQRAMEFLGDFEMIGLMTAFVMGYYIDVVMELFSASKLLSSPSSFNLGLALLFILFTTPLACWLLLFANSLEATTRVPCYLSHVVPVVEFRRFIPRWCSWYWALLDARKGKYIQPLPVKKPPALVWLPICKAAFGSSMSTIFKIYGSFLIMRDFLLGGRTGQPPSLSVVFLSVMFSCMSMGKSLVGLSNYGNSISLTTMACEIAWRSIEVASRVGSVALLGLIFVEVHSITVLGLLDFVPQLTLLLVHPRSRSLMRREMSLSMLIFWALLMVLCAPPRFIPQLGDIHPVYYLIRVMELGIILGTCSWRCSLASQSAQVEAACEVANPFAPDTPRWGWALLLCTWAASVLMPLIWLEWYQQKRRALRARVRTYEKEQAELASDRAGCAAEPLAYGELLYIKVCSLPNRFLCAGKVDGGDPVMAVCKRYTVEMKDSEEDVAKAGWRILPSEGSEVDEAKGRTYIKFGDVVKLHSELGETLLLSGGRRGNNMYATVANFLEDLKQWSLDYAMNEHYLWRVVAISHDGPDPHLQEGETVGLNARFALQAMPTSMLHDELHLSACRGATTAKDRAEVWTVDFRSRLALEDKPLEGSWPSFEFTAVRQLSVATDEVVQLVEEVHEEVLRREKALVEAGKDDDVMMMTFMMESGVPMWVTDRSYYTPLHHFIMGYARERDQFMQRNGLSAEEASKVAVPHKLPIKLFHEMLHSGLPTLELGAAQMYTPLHFAALLGQRHLCEMLLEDGTDINARDSEGWTCLHDAVLSCHSEMLAFLLSHDDLDVNQCALNGVRPLDLADEEARGWLVAAGAELRPGERAPNACERPPLPLGRELPTKFVDPREYPDLSKSKCEVDNQSIISKELAILDPEGGVCCLYCSRAAWNGFRSNLCPMFRCPKCHNLHRIPYGDSFWEVCWACQTCGDYPHQARLEPGKLDLTGQKAKQLFEKLDVDGNGRLSKEEFKAFFQMFEGHGAVDLGKQAEAESGKTLESSYAEEIFKKIDTDESGDLSLDELKAFFGCSELAVGLRVKVQTAFETISSPEETVEEGDEGVVLHIDEDGDAFIVFENVGQAWVSSRDFPSLEQLDPTTGDLVVENETPEKLGAASLARKRKRKAIRRRTTFSPMPCLESCLLLA